LQHNSIDSDNAHVQINQHSDGIHWWDFIIPIPETTIEIKTRSGHSEMDIPEPSEWYRIPAPTLHRALRYKTGKHNSGWHTVLRNQEL